MPPQGSHEGANYEQKMFLQLARESGEEAAEVFRHGRQGRGYQHVEEARRSQEAVRQEEQPRALYRQSPKKGDYQAVHGILPKCLRASKPDERDEPAGSGHHVWAGSDGFRPKGQAFGGRMLIDKSKSMCNAGKKYWNWTVDAACCLLSRGGASRGNYPELLPPGEEKYKGESVFWAEFFKNFR